MKNNIFEIKLDGLTLRTKIIITDDLVKVYKGLRRKHKKSVVLDKRAKGYLGVVINQFIEEFGICYVIIKRESGKVPILYLSHEILHLTQTFFKFKNMNEPALINNFGYHFYENEEKYCELNALLMTAVMEKLLKTNETFAYFNHGFSWDVDNCKFTSICYG